MALLWYQLQHRRQFSMLLLLQQAQLFITAATLKMPVSVASSTAATWYFNLAGVSGDLGIRDVYTEHAHRVQSTHTGTKTLTQTRAASQLLCAQPLKRFIKTTHGTQARFWRGFEWGCGKGAGAFPSEEKIVEKP